VVPQVGIGNDKARLRRGDRHTPRYSSSIVSR
jgi:hypothetical protein